jgi:hypothetical protein
VKRIAAEFYQRGLRMCARDQNDCHSKHQRGCEKGRRVSSTLRSEGSSIHPDFLIPWN